MKEKARCRKGKGHNVGKELREIDRLFADIAKDKAVPTFGDFFMTCLILGIADRVNLKKMYPKTYVKLNDALVKHNERIRAMRLQARGK